MPVNTQDILEVVCILADEENIQITVRESVRGGIITGLAAAVGGITLGPIGLAVGGTLGGIYSAISSHGKFKSAVEIIKCMRCEDQQRLANAILNVTNNIDIHDAARLTALIAGDAALRQQILDVIVNFLKNEMHMEIID